LDSQHTNTKLTCLWTGEIDTVLKIRTKDPGKVQRSLTAVAAHINTSILIGHGGLLGHRYRKKVCHRIGQLYKRDKPKGS